LAVASLLWVGVILGAIGVSLAGGGPWWQLIPLGLVVRLMAAANFSPSPLSCCRSHWT
jgi:hypothetical protein